MARKGARVVLEPGDGQDRPRDFQDRDRGGSLDREPWEPEVWIRDADAEGDPSSARRARRSTGSAGGRPGRSRPSRVGGAGGRTRDTDGPTGSRRPTRDSGRSVAQPGRSDRSAGARTGPAAGQTSANVRTATAAARQQRRIAEAAKAYEADRYADVRRLLKPLLMAGDPSPEVRELHGLTLYRMGRWADAIAELRAFASATGSYDQHPVLADCHRALKRWKAVDELWEEIRAASPGPDVVAEGRIVAAGALADRGDIGEALKLLERAPSNVKRPALHHLRLWYAQADLYERAGEIPRARELFRTILRHDPSFVDTAERLAALE
ncbi:MAG TPA: tetratricopeptide repeat protein [Acidimicrobiales bacterium]|nr:tetratricopeptide repeat protein [Acidimicrobiales bacterium]